jgi:uncharacterized membrane protein YphA (DoxX/SURF4 family)
LNRSTTVFLVLLRLAIGWHFLFEGIEKVRSMRMGPSDTNRPFSSAGYFREAQGPLGIWLRPTLGDPYQEAHDLLTNPTALARRWDDLFDRFARQYHLDQEQRDKGKGLVEEAKTHFATLLTWHDLPALKDKFHGDIPEAEKKSFLIHETTITFPKVETKVDETLAQRVQKYNTLFQEVRVTQPDRFWQFGKEVEKQRYLKAKTELEQARVELMKDLDEQTTTLKKNLEGLLTEKQRGTKEVPPSAGGGVLAILDPLTAYGLTIAGACLILGLLTRINCLFLASFLFMTFLAVPPFPWLPVPPNTEGNYFFVNKNLIEMLALLTLATTTSGRWLGVDALIHGVWTWLTRPRRASHLTPAPQSPKPMALTTR